MKNNKFLFIILFFAFTTSFCFSESLHAKRIAIFNTDGESLSAGESSWLPASIRRKFESNFNDFTDYLIVEVQNEAEIKNLQKKAESSNYDQSSSIELGKLLSAEYGLFSTVTYANGRYILSASITNLTTGVRLSSTQTDSVKECSSLFEGAGCSVNVATVKFCEDLGITLSSIDKYILLKGDNLSDEEELSMTEKELDLYKDKISDLEKQIKTTSVSTNLDAETIKAKLEAEKALLQERQKLAQERLERLRKERQQYLTDQVDELARSEAQKKRIEQVAREAEEKARSLRNSRLENLTVDGQIAIIEAKKQALLEIRKDILEQKATILKYHQEDYAKAAAEIDNAPLRMAEKDSNGNILPEVKALRDAKKKELKEKYDAQAEKDILGIKNQIKVQEDALLAAIAQDQNTLKAKHTVSSITDPSILFIGAYDGKRHVWEGVASLSIGDNVIFSQSANLNYESVSGKKYVSPNGNSSAYEDYLDTVDMYDSMFRRKVPAVSLEIDYVVEAEPENKPSTYKLTVSNFRYINILTGKVIQTIVPAKTVFNFTINPVVDIRYGKALTSSLIDEKNLISSSEEKKVEAVKKETKKETAPKKSILDTGRLNVGFTETLIMDTNNLVPYGEYGSVNTYPMVNAYISVPIFPHLFLQLEGGVFIADYESFYIGLDQYTITDTYAYDIMFEAGINFKLNLFGWKPNLYALAGVGYISSDTLYYVGNYNTYEESYGLLCGKVGVGIDFPYREIFCVTIEYDYITLDFYNMGPAFTFGLAVSL